MADSRGNSRKNTENESSIEVVQIDGLVIMKLIKHCHELEASTSGSGIAQGALLGLVTDTRLEITHCFPFPSGTDETVDDEDFQLTMMRRLRQVNVDHQHVGWYQSSQFGNFLSPQLLESQFSYQTSIDESVCLIFDTAKTAQGFLSLKAYRMTRDAVKMFKENDFSPDSIKDLHISAVPQEGLNDAGVTATAGCATQWRLCFVVPERLARRLWVVFQNACDALFIVPLQGFHQKWSLTRTRDGSRVACISSVCSLRRCPQRKVTNWCGRTSSHSTMVDRLLSPQ